MSKNKDDMKGGSQDPMSNKPDSEFAGQGTESEKSGKQAAGSGNGAGSQRRSDKDDIKTSGGRKGNFSDKNRDSESPWSPGSSQSSDQ